MASLNNQGTYISGGTVTAHQLVSGSNARAESIVNASSQVTAGDRNIDDLRKQIDALAVLIQENRHCVAPGTEQAMEVVKQEAAKPEPSKFVISAVLDSVSATVKSFAPIASAVTAVSKLVTLIL